MEKTRLFIGLAILVLGLTSGSRSGFAVVYGSDDRYNLSEVKDGRLRALADASAVMVYAEQVTSGGKGVVLRGMTRGQYASRSYCASESHPSPDCEKRYVPCAEKFADEPAIGRCSGVLIGKRRILTARHCLKEALSGIRWVFGYDDSSVRSGKSATVGNDLVFRPVRLVDSGATADDDVAIVELDRDVPGRAPVKVANVLSSGIGRSVFSFGYPLGMPLKFAFFGNVLAEEKGRYLYHDLDLQNGNSGSPIFDGKTGSVIGVNVRGKPSFDWWGEKDCVRQTRIERNRYILEDEGGHAVKGYLEEATFAGALFRRKN